MMDTTEIRKALERRQREYNECTAADALAASVDTPKFYRFASSITDIEIVGESVEVTFNEPVPGVTTLSDNYSYSITVGRETPHSSNSRCEMPKEDLLTLQQITITIWAMATGEMYG